MTIDVNLAVRRGDFGLDARFCVPNMGISGVLGPSGSGKTTLLRAMAGLERHCHGELNVNGQAWQGTKTLPAHKRPVGFVFQESSLFPHMNVRKNILFGYNRVPQSLRRISEEQAVHYLQLEALLHRNPENLSGGEKQRVSIARALLSSPALLLMDEPLAGLDETSKSEIIGRLIQVQKQAQIPIIYVSHVSDEIARLCDFLVLLENGDVLAHGPLTELLTRTDLPLANSLDAKAIIEGVIVSHDSEYELSELSFANQRLWVSGNKQEQSDPVRVRIMARDVSLALQAPLESSILNVLPSTVDSLTPMPNARVLVRLKLDGYYLLAQITKKSAQVLGLQPGKLVYAQIKSVALLD